MAGPNIGQTEAASSGVNETSAESIKSITVVPDGAADSIFSMLFCAAQDGEKKINEQ